MVGGEKEGERLDGKECGVEMKRDREARRRSVAGKGRKQRGETIILATQSEGGPFAQRYFLCKTIHECSFSVI